MTVQRYDVDQDGDLEKAKYGSLVTYSDYLKLEAKYDSLQCKQPAETKWYMITYTQLGVRTVTNPLANEYFREQLNKLLNDGSCRDVKVFAVKPVQSAYLVSHKRLKDIASYKSVVTYYEINTILERLYADKDVCQITVHALIPVELNIKTVATMPF